MKGAPEKHQGATLSDLLAIPEGERRHEIIGGTLVEKEAASGRHGGAQLALGHLLFPFRRRGGGDSPGGWWFASDVEIFFDPLTEAELLFLRGLTSAGARFMVVGLGAAVLQGADAVTQDLDLWFHSLGDRR